MLQTRVDPDKILVASINAITSISVQPSRLPGPYFFGVMDFRFGIAIAIAKSE